MSLARKCKLTAVDTGEINSREQNPVKYRSEICWSSTPPWLHEIQIHFSEFDLYFYSSEKCDDIRLLPNPSRDVHAQVRQRFHDYESMTPRPNIQTAREQTSIHKGYSLLQSPADGANKRRIFRHCTLYNVFVQA